MRPASDAYQARIEKGEITADPAQQAMLPALDRVLTDLTVAAAPQKRGFFRKATKTEPQLGLYLWGGVGRGKSMLMDMVAELAEVPKRRAHFHAFMQWVHAEMAEVRKTGVDDAIAPVADKLAAEVRLLAFDEMQITDITDAMIVGRFFERIFEAGVMVITTSNRPPQDLYKDGLNRQLFLPFIEMLGTHMEVLELASATDYRQTVLEGAQTYFTPLGAKAREGVNRLWENLCDGPAAPLVLKVKGREVELPRFSNGVARARFHDLCAKPLGPADYLALAEAVKVLLLEDVPQLSRSNFNEAKRFVTLIDALYEAKTRLILSAAAEPEMLYVEGEGVFEFERTASRLREMQGAAWWDDG